MADDVLDRPIGASQPITGSLGEYFTLLGKSALTSATTELVGMHAPSDVEQFRAENPISGMLSELAGMAVPYFGWERAVMGGAKLALGGRTVLGASEGLGALSRVKGAAEAAEAAAGGVLKSPFLAGGAKSATLFAPFELGRVGANALVGDKSWGEALGEAGINTALTGVIGGGLEKLASGGLRAKTQANLFAGEPDVLTSATPLRLRRLDEMRATELDPARIGAMDNLRSQWDDLARTEVSDRYLNPLVKGDGEALETLFRPGTERTTQSRKLAATQGADTFNSPAEWKGMQIEAGLPEGFTSEVQYPRVLSFSKERDWERAAQGAMDLERESRAALSSLEASGAKPDAFVQLDQMLAAKRAEAKAPTIATRAAAKTEARIAGNMDQIGDGWFATREADDGLYVMARKFRGEVGKASPEDHWVIFKTDRPERFAPESKRFGDAQVARERWIVGDNSIEKNIGRPGELFTEMHKAVTNVAPRDAYMGAVAKVGPGKGIGTMLANYVPEGIKANAIADQAASLIKTYFTPAAKQFGDSSRAGWLFGARRMIQDIADTRAQVIMQGEAKLDASKGLLRPLVTGGGESTRSVEQIVNEVAAKGTDVFNQFFDLFRQGQVGRAGLAMAEKGLISRDAANAAAEIGQINARLMREVNRAQDAAGVAQTLWREGHGGLSRKWDGDIFTALRDEGGNIVGMASGNNKRQSLANAAELRTRIGDDTQLPVRIGETFERNTTEALPADLRAYISNPGFMMKRGQLRGFKWDLETPTPEQFLKDYSVDTYKRTRHVANLAQESLLAKDLGALAVESPRDFTNMVTRFNQMSGQEGWFSQVQNRLADKVLAPWIGSNSASKIVSYTNAGLNHLMLGGLKLSYPISNIIGVLQTTAPEVAFLLSADPARLARAGYAYTHVPMIGEKGAVGSMGVLNPLGMMKKSVQELRSPTPDMVWGLERAINERVIGDRTIEEFTGQSAKALKDWRGALQSPGKFWEATKALSNFMPAASERFARTHAYGTAWVTFRDLMGVSDKEQLHRLASQFVARTQYLYAGADRPLAFTSPLGSSMGLFKNWMMNYVHTMAEYAGEGLAHGNWAPMAWQTAASLGVGGISATPLKWVADGFTNAFAKKDMLNWTYDEFGNNRFSDGLVYGLPAALTGISFSSSMSEPGANPLRDASQLFSVAAWDRAKALGGAAKSAMDNWQATGSHPASDPDVRGQLIKAFAPVTLYRAFAGDPTTGTVRSLGSGLPQIKGMSSTDIYLYQMGLQPIQLEKMLTVAEELYSSREKNKAMTSRLGDAFSDAQQSGDSRMMDRVLLNVVAQGADMSAVMRSAATRTKQANEDVATRLSKPADMAKFGSVLER